MKRNFMVFVLSMIIISLLFVTDLAKNGQILLAPTELSITNMSTDSISLSWTERSPNVTGFEVWYSRNGIKFSKLSTTIFTSYTAKNLKSSTFSSPTYYYFKVRARNSNNHSKWSNIVSAMTLIYQKIRKTISLKNTPYGIVVDPISNMVYVFRSSGFYSYAIDVIDGTTYKIIKEIGPIKDGFSNFRSMRVNPITNMVYVSLGSTIIIINGTTDKIVKTINMDGSAKIAINPTTNMIYAANFANDVVIVIDGLTYKILKTIPLGGDPYSITVNPITNTIYVAWGDSIGIIDGKTNEITKVIPVESGFKKIMINPISDLIYGVMRNSVTVINGITDRVTGIITVNFKLKGPDFSDGAVSPTSNLVYLIDSHSSRVDIIDGVRNKVIQSIFVGHYYRPVGIAINSETNKAYVINERDKSISVIY